MNSDVQLCQFEHDGVPMSLVLRSLPDDLLALELRDHFPPVRSLSFTADMLEQMLGGNLDCIESPDRQCALMREDDHIEIVFSAPEVGEHTRCEVAMAEIRSALAAVTGNQAYAA